MASVNVRVDDEFKKDFVTSKEESECKNEAEFLKLLLNIFPLYQAIQAKGLTMDDAIAKINADSIVTEIKVIRKGVNEIEFNKWMEKLFSHNATSEDEDKVYITQNLFLHLIGGNVNSISKLYKENELTILEHNEKMGIDKNQNRKLSSRIRETHGNVVNWIKAKTA
jgi:hypothetical protein